MYLRDDLAAHVGWQSMSEGCRRPGSASSVLPRSINPLSPQARTFASFQAKMMVPKHQWRRGRDGGCGWVVVEERKEVRLNALEAFG